MTIPDRRYPHLLMMQCLTLFYCCLLSETGIDLAAAQELLEKFYIEQALRLAQGNESKAATLLRMNHHTFRYRKKKLLIE